MDRRGEKASRSRRIVNLAWRKHSSRGLSCVCTVAAWERTPTAWNSKPPSRLDFTSLSLSVSLIFQVRESQQLILHLFRSVYACCLCLLLYGKEYTCFTLLVFPPLSSTGALYSFLKISHVIFFQSFVEQCYSVFDAVQKNYEDKNGISEASPGDNFYIEPRDIVVRK